MRGFNPSYYVQIYPFPGREVSANLLLHQAPLWVRKKFYTELESA